MEHFGRSCVDGLTPKSNGQDQEERDMPLSVHDETVIPPDEHILTVQEALEPLYQKLEQETEMKLVEAAVEAGWSPYEALHAIDQLKKQDAA
jgi:hypothetical protein